MARRQLEVSNEVAAELAGSHDSILKTLEEHLDAQVFLRGNVVTLDGEAEAVQEATGDSVDLAYVDQGYTGPDAEIAAADGGIALEVVKLPEAKRGFVLLPRRWVVERSFAWLGRYRRNSRDYEWHPHSSESMIRISSIHRMLRLLKPDESRVPIPFKYRELQGKITG